MRFTIRDVLWLTALAAILVAWSLDRSSSKADLKSALDLAGKREAMLRAEKNASEGDRKKLLQKNETISKDFRLMLKRLHDRDIDYRELLANPTPQEKRSLALP
jgi:hypothetical protein